MVSLRGSTVGFSQSADAVASAAGQFTCGARVWACAARQNPRNNEAAQRAIALNTPPRKSLQIVTSELNLDKSLGLCQIGLMQIFSARSGGIHRVNQSIINFMFNKISACRIYPR